jgi:endonuclease V-like protein UPF0215 family
MRIVLVLERFLSVKSEIRVVGIDDGRFVPRTKGTAIVVGVVYRGGCWFEGVMHTKITIDGLDATANLAAMIKDSPYYGELRVVVLDGITFAGFNVVDVNKLSATVGLPVISVVRDKPDLDEIKSALKKLSEFEQRWQSMQNAGRLFVVEVRDGENPVYLQTSGILIEDAKKILRITSTRSNIPEPLRVAHLIASGLTDGK